MTDERKRPHTGGRAVVPAQVRFWKFVQKTEKCWLWTAHKIPSGYGVFNIRPPDGRWPYGHIGAHRFSYELVHGPIPKGFTLDHLCRNPGCVNPEHLEAVTSRENTIRGEGPSAVNHRKTHCLRGHEFNRIDKKTGQRICRTCKNITRRRLRAEGKGISKNGWARWKAKKAKSTNS